MAPVLRVGLTGGIGAGKSTVARALARLGALVVDADQLARRVVEPGSPGLDAVVAAFGPQVLTADGALDRPALGRLVFADEAARGRLNAIVHPRIAALTAQELAAAPADAVVVHDVPLLVENGLGPNYHLVLVVAAPVDERVRRLGADRDLTEDEALARIGAQADDTAREAAADVLLDNSGGPEALVAVLERLWHERLLPYEENLRLRRCADPAPAADAAARARVAARLRAGLGDGGRVDDSDPLLVRVRRGLPDDRLAAALSRAGIVLRPDGRPCAADPAVAVAVRLERE
jgi:dephospho-CoA kinase